MDGKAIIMERIDRRFRKKPDVENNDPSKTAGAKPQGAA